MEFKNNKNDLNKRKELSEQLKKQYPDKIPLIIEKYFKSNLPKIDKENFLLSTEFTLYQLIFLLRKRLFLEKEINFYLYAQQNPKKQILLKDNLTLNELYNLYKNEDNFLYIFYFEKKL
jgi:GABA(A) receptor-associated protein